MSPIERRVRGARYSTELAPNADELLEQLRALYARADALLDSWSCPGSTECCRFGITGREPYVTSLELLAIERALARRGGGARGNHKRSLALAPSLARERACPLLDAQGRCSVYADRPLGCRSFFCARATPGSARTHTTRELRELVRELRELAARHTPEGEHGRPLTRSLGGIARG
jgi:Fe-S-cluster containining protein